jgi:hypothetical protein
VSGREYIALADEVVAAILVTVREGWDLAAIDRKTALDGEVAMTERLRDGMRQALRSGTLAWGKSFIVALGMESRSSPDVTTPDGRTDIPLYVVEVFLRYAEHDPHAIIECKRLDGSDTHLCREYVVEGVDRFRSGKYAENHASGFMAGYLLSGDAQSAATGVNAYLGRVKRADEQIVLSAVVDHPAFWRSEHARTVERPDIAIHHVLLGLTARS